MSSPHCLRLVIEYDGTRYSGWQIQEGPSAPITVQGELEKALYEFCGERIRVRGASRTDAGVHARGQTVALDTTRTIPPIGYARGLRKFLPPDIVVRKAELAPEGWDPRRSSRGKRYIYSIWNDVQPSALERGRTWWVQKPLDLGQMAAAAQIMIGTHDFDAFRAVGCVAKHAIRTLYAVNIHPRGGSRIDLEVVGNAFVRNMVRIMAGTLVEVGSGRKTPQDVSAAFLSRQRKDAGVTAPPQGLCLDEVIYDQRLPSRPKDNFHVKGA